MHYNAALRHGDHVLMLKDGRLVASGAPETVITASVWLKCVPGTRTRAPFAVGKLQVPDGVIAA